MTQATRTPGSRSAPASRKEYAPELETFYRQFFLPLVRRAVRKQGLSMEDAGDVVQDAFILALGKLDTSKNPKAWLYQVVDHLARNWRRKDKRHTDLLARWKGVEPDRRSSPARPDEEATHE